MKIWMNVNKPEISMARTVAVENMKSDNLFCSSMTRIQSLFNT